MDPRFIIFFFLRTGFPGKDDEKIDDVVPEAVLNREEDLESGHKGKPDLQGSNKANQPTGN